MKAGITLVILSFMKTAVSISDDLFRRAEELAKRKKVSRSSLYSRAIEKYVEEEEEVSLIEQINKVCDEVDTSLDPFWKAAQARTLAREEW